MGKRLLIGEKTWAGEVIGHRSTPKMLYNIIRCGCGETRELTNSEIKRGGRQHKSCMSLIKTTDQHAGLKALFFSSKELASRRNISWNLTFDQYCKIVQQPCYLCGEEPYKRERVSNSKGRVVVVAAHGPDRIDNELDYSPHNTASCCKECNLAKSNRTYDEWKRQVNKWYKKIGEKSG